MWKSYKLLPGTIPTFSGRFTPLPERSSGKSGLLMNWALIWIIYRTFPTSPESGSGNDDLLQVVHATYGSVLTAERENGTSLFSKRCFKVLYGKWWIM